MMCLIKEMMCLVKEMMCLMKEMICLVKEMVCLIEKKKEERVEKGFVFMFILGVYFGFV